MTLPTKKMILFSAEKKVIFLSHKHVFIRTVHVFTVSNLSIRYLLSTELKITIFLLRTFSTFLLVDKEIHINVEAFNCIVMFGPSTKIVTGFYLCRPQENHSQAHRCDYSIKTHY